MRNGARIHTSGDLGDASKKRQAAPSPFKKPRSRPRIIVTDSWFIAGPTTKVRESATGIHPAKVQECVVGSFCGPAGCFVSGKFCVCIFT